MLIRLYPVVAACALSSLALAGPAFAHHPGAGGNTGIAGPIFAIPASTLDEGQTADGALFEYAGLRIPSDQTLTSAAVAGDVHDLKTIESTSAILDKWSSYVSVGFPVVNEPIGIQREPSWPISNGMSLAF
jgi:hypothetical protein